MNARKIQSTYYGMAKEVVQINLAKYERSAIMRATDHMSMNDYAAAVCVVFDTNTAEEHATITRSVTGELHISYKRDPTRFRIE